MYLSLSVLMNDIERVCVFVCLCVCVFVIHIMMTSSYHFDQTNCSTVTATIVIGFSLELADMYYYNFLGLG